MGEDKALLELNGKSFIQQITETLQRVLNQVVIISDRGEKYQFLDLAIYEDIFKECGPLGGIHSALRNAQTEKVFIVSCDLPLMTSDAIRYIVDRADASNTVVPSVRKMIQPLCGIYGETCLPALEDYLSRGQRKVQQFVKKMNAIVLSMDPELPIDHPEVFTNINTSEDYQKLIEKSKLRSLDTM